MSPTPTNPKESIGKEIVPAPGRAEGNRGGAGSSIAVGLLLYLVFLMSLIVYSLFVFWPAPAGNPSFVRFVIWTLSVTDEVRLFVIVVVSGALGGAFHAIRSLYWYVGHQWLKKSWISMYVLLPFEGTAVALLLYLVVRGGLFSFQASVADVNPFGFAALAGLSGLFSDQAVVKLSEIAGRIFAPKEEVKGADDYTEATSPQPGRSELSQPERESAQTTEARGKTERLPE